MMEWGRLANPGARRRPAEAALSGIAADEAAGTEYDIINQSINRPSLKPSCEILTSDTPCSQEQILLHPNMANSQQHEGTHEASVVHKSSQPIYDAAQLCLTHFEHHLETGGTGEDYLAMEDLRGRFNQWVAYVGA